MKAPIVPMSDFQIPRLVMSVFLSISTPYQPGDVSHPGSSASSVPPVVDRPRETHSDRPSKSRVENTLEDRLHTYSESEVASGRLSWLDISSDNSLGTQSAASHDVPCTDAQHDNHLMVEYIDHLMEEDILVEPLAKRRKEIKSDNEGVSQGVLDYWLGTEMGLETSQMSLLDDSAGTDNASSPICSLLEADSQLEDHVVDDYLNSLLHAGLLDRPTLEVLDESTLSSLLHPVPSGGSTEPCLGTQELHQREGSDTRIQNCEYGEAAQDVPGLDAPVTLLSKAPMSKTQIVTGELVPPAVKSVPHHENQVASISHLKAGAFEDCETAPDTRLFMEPSTCRQNTSQAIQLKEWPGVRSSPNMVLRTPDSIHQVPEELGKERCSKSVVCAETTLESRSIDIPVKTATLPSTSQTVVQPQSTADAIIALLNLRDKGLEPPQARPTPKTMSTPMVTEEAVPPIVTEAEQVLRNLRESLMTRPSPMPPFPITPFGITCHEYESAPWLLQMYLSCSRKMNMQGEKVSLKHPDCAPRTQMETAFAMHGHDNVDVLSVFERAHTILRHMNPTITDRALQYYAQKDPSFAKHAMAAELVHAALFRAPFIAEPAKCIAEHNVHTAAHSLVVEQLVEARLAYSSSTQPRGWVNDTMFRQDWAACMKAVPDCHERPHHPFSFSQFLRDLNKIVSKDVVKPVVLSKYRKVLGVDLEFELKRIKETYAVHPAPFAVLQGLKDGSIPSRYGLLYTHVTSRGHTFLINPQCLAGALVLLYKRAVLGKELQVSDLGTLKVLAVEIGGRERAREKLEELLASDKCQFKDVRDGGEVKHVAQHLSPLQDYLLNGRLSGVE